MRYRAAVLSVGLGCLIAAPVSAGEDKLSSAAIDALLPTIIAVGDGTRQTFSAKGATTYSDRGRDSYGTWAAQGDQYCSQWPPADGWACYDVLRDGDRLIWIGESGHRTITTIEPKG